MGVGFYGNSETSDGVYQLIYSLDDANHTLSGIDALVRLMGSWLGTQPRRPGWSDQGPQSEPSQRLQAGPDAPSRAGLPPRAAVSPARSTQVSAERVAGMGVRTQGERLVGPVGVRGGRGIRPCSSSRELNAFPIVPGEPEHAASLGVFLRSF